MMVEKICNGVWYNILFAQPVANHSTDWPV
jgi:hypothetical protein